MAHVPWWRSPCSIAYPATICPPTWTTSSGGSANRWAKHRRTYDRGKSMTLGQSEQISNYAVASATVVLGLAFVAYVAQWGFARNVAPDHALVGAGAAVT